LLYELSKFKSKRIRSCSDSEKILKKEKKMKKNFKLAKWKNKKIFNQLLSSSILRKYREKSYEMNSDRQRKVIQIRVNELN